MCKMGQYLPLSQYHAKHLQYLQPVVNLWICILISDAIIPKKLSFKKFSFVNFDFSCVFAKNACFLCALCSNVTEFCSLLMKKTMQKPLWKRQVCTKFINETIENTQSQKSSANRTFYNVAMRHFYLNFSCLFCCDKIPIWNFNISICFLQWARYKIRNLLCRMKSRTWV